MSIYVFYEIACNRQDQGTDTDVEPFFISGGPASAQLPDQNVARGGAVRDLDARRIEGPRIQRWLKSASKVP